MVNTPGVPDYAKRKAEPMFERHLKSFRLAVEMGVKIGSGSDAFSDPVTPFGKYNSHEIKLQQDACLSPIEALRAATSSNAELLGLDKELGSLEEGKLADLIVVKGDLSKGVEPVTDHGNLTVIMQGGRRIPRLKDALPQ